MAAKPSDRTYLRQEEKDVLKSMLEEWTSQADKKNRDAFMSGTVLPKIQQLNLVEFGRESIERDKLSRIGWEKRVSAVHTWFKNHKPFKDRQVFKLERKIPLRRVVGKLKAVEIENIIRDKYPDLPKGDKTYPGIYQQAVTEYMAQMSEEEEQEMQSILQEWQSEGPPMECRLKAAKKYGRKAIINAHQLLEKEMYISCITVSMVPDVDTGAIGVTCHDYIADAHAQKHGKKFKTFSEWSGPKYNLFIQQMIDYANYVKEQRSEEVEQGGGAMTEPVAFEAGPGDLPLLPPPVLGVRSEETAKTAKEIVRAFFLRHYQLAVGNDSAKTPWAQIGEQPSKFFDVECVPANFKISDPSRMGVHVKSLLSHLRKRQEDYGVHGFHFRNVLRNGALEPASYPVAAKAVLEPAAQDIEMTQQSEEPKSPVKANRASKTKSPKKSKSPKKQKGSSKSVKKEDSTYLVKETHSTTPETVDPPMQHLPSLDPNPGKEPPVSNLSTSTPSIPNSAPQLFSFDIQPDTSAQYDPVLLPDNHQTNPPPGEQHQGLGPPTWPHNNGPAHPPPYPPQFHQTHFPDHRYAIMQQMLSQWGIPPPWHPALAPQHSQQTSEPPPHGFYQLAPLPAPVLNAFPTTMGTLDSHPIPPGEPPFATIRHPIPPPVPISMQNPITASISQPPKNTPKKRKIESEEQESPSKKPTRSSNRTKTPRKERV